MLWMVLDGMMHPKQAQQALGRMHPKQAQQALGLDEVECSPQLWSPIMLWSVHPMMRALGYSMFEKRSTRPPCGRRWSER